MASTAIPAVKAAVLSRLQSAATLEKVTVKGGLEPIDKKEYVWIWKGRAKREWGSLGRHKLDETVRVFIRVVAIRAKLDDAEARAYQLVDAVESSLREDLQLGHTVRFHLIEDLDEELAEFDDKYGCSVLMIAAAKQQI